MSDDLLEEVDLLFQEADEWIEKQNRLEKHRKKRYLRKLQQQIFDAEQTIRVQKSSLQEMVRLEVEKQISYQLSSIDLFQKAKHVVASVKKMDKNENKSDQISKEILKENLAEELKRLKTILDERKELEKKIEWEKVNLLKEK